MGHNANRDQRAADDCRSDPCGQCLRDEVGTRQEQERAESMEILARGSVHRALPPGDHDVSPRAVDSRAANARDGALTR
jgi:hypothetical protein